MSKSKGIRCLQGFALNRPTPAEAAEIERTKAAIREEWKTGTPWYDRNTEKGFRGPKGRVQFLGMSHRDE